MPTTTAQPRTYGSAPRHAAASRRRLNATRAASSRPAADEWLTVDEVCSELKIGRRTFERWRALGTAPPIDFAEYARHLKPAARETTYEAAPSAKRPLPSRRH